MNAIYGKSGQNKVRKTHFIGDISFINKVYDERKHLDLTKNQVGDTKYYIYDY